MFWAVMLLVGSCLVFSTLWLVCWSYCLAAEEIGVYRRRHHALPRAIAREVKR